MFSIFSNAFLTYKGKFAFKIQLYIITYFDISRHIKRIFVQLLLQHNNNVTRNQREYDVGEFPCF